MDRLRGFINRMWPRPSHTPQLITTTALGEESTNREKRVTSLRRQPFRPVNALGPLYLDLFERLHRCYKQLQISERFFDEVQQDRRYFHGVADYRTCELNRLRDDDRADFTVATDQLAAAKFRAESDHDDLKARLDEHRPSFKKVSARIIDLWDQVYQHGQTYLDRCLDVSFGEDWSLSHQECIAMRPLIDIHFVLQQRKGALRQLQYDGIAARVNPGGVSQEIEDQIEILKDKIEMTQKSQDEAQREFVTTHLDEMLRRAGVIEQSQQEDDDQQHQQQYDTEGEGETHLHPERRSEDYDPTGNYDNPADYAIAEFYQTRNAHEELQARVSRRQQELLASETQHLITFPKSSITRFRLLVDRLTADDVGTMQEAEVAWIEAYENLLSLGIPIPQTPERGPEQVPTGGGLGGDEEGGMILSSGSGQRRKRRKLNRVRAGIVQNADPGRSPSLPRSRDLGGLGSNSQGWERRTASLSPATRSERKRRLREYEAGMEDEWETG